MKINLWGQENCLRHRSGSVLIITVWMLGMLVLLALSIGHRAHQEIAMVQYSLQKMQTRYLAWAGFHYVLSQIKKDSLDEESGKFDNQLACGVKLESGKTAESIFKNVPLGRGSFTVSRMQNPGLIGLGDEESKVNLNAFTLQNYGILKELFVLVGVVELDAQKMAAAVQDWHDEDSEPAIQVKGAHEGPFELQGIKFSPKNRPYDNIYELMYVKGMTLEIYEKITPFITVYPHQPDRFKINLATAAREVIQATARFYSGPATNTSTNDADRLTDKIIVYRRGSDRSDGTIDDQVIDENKMSLTISEIAIYRAMMQSETKTSRFLSFRVSGFVANKVRQSYLDAVVDRDTLTIVYWRND